ncbi:helix-turn-helix domain-containing protein [Aquimarina rubra]|uniref:Helix-turn-helix domain-containing protein n=1 Tax=Aquimarina rubra TaxID=1920033 RepID=A0ABW5LD35_9FLAO
MKKPYVFKAFTEKYQNSTIERNEASKIMRKLQTLMEEKKLYLNPTLSLFELSAELSISSKELSQVINQIESKNYSQYISEYRVKEAQHLLTAPDYSKITITAIAYDSGFNSISTFNSAFKKHSGMTAFEYRKANE